MNFKPYPEYKNFDKGWAPRLPKSWKLTQLRHVARIYAGGTPDRNNPDFWSNGTVPWLNSGAVNDWSITSPSDWITDLAATGGFTRWVPPKSVVVALAGQGKTKGMAARLEFRSTCNQSMAAVVPSKFLDYRFLQFWLTANYENVRNLAGGDLRDGLNLRHIGGIYIPLPSKEEQWAIADFLDREIAEIEQFIEDQERLIQLLEERRAATVAHAVTKGLDPTVPMKDSGTEWVGNIPASWDMKRISWLFGTISSGTTPPVQISEYFDGEFNWVTTSELRETSITHTNRTITRKALREFPSLRLYGPGTLLIAMYGATIGRLGLLETPAATNQACCAFSEPVGTSSKFVFYVLLAAREHLMMLADGGGQPNINQDKLRSLRIPQPDLKTQNEIVDFLDQETSALDAAVADAREAIVLSRERRAALISAAVTGQVDVSQAQSRGSAGEVLEQGVRV